MSFCLLIDFLIVNTFKFFSEFKTLSLESSKDVADDQNSAVKIIAKTKEKLKKYSDRKKHNLEDSRIDFRKSSPKTQPNYLLNESNFFLHIFNLYYYLFVSKNR